MRSRIGLFWAVCLAGHARAGGITYKVTLNPEACHEVHLGRLKVPAEVGPRYSDVIAGGFFYDLRFAGGPELYLSTVTQSRNRLVASPEKYAVDLSRPRRVRRVTDAEWESAPLLPRSKNGAFPNRSDGIEYRGPVLKRSGPKWSGIGVGPPPESFFSLGMRRAAVNSWDGYEILAGYNEIFLRDKIRGTIGSTSTIPLAAAL